MLIAHIADIHIGMTNYGTINPETGIHTRLEDFDQSLGEVIATCIERKVDVVVFAGDAYKNALPTSTYRGIFEGRFKELIDRKIPIVLIPGNHDSTGSYGSLSALQSFQTLADIKVIDTPRQVRIDAKSGELVVSCMPWPTKRMLLDVDSEYHRLPPDEILLKLQEHVVQKLQELDRENLSINSSVNKILLGHLDVAEADYSSEQTMMIKHSLVIPLEALVSLESYGYIALGHVHKYQNLNAFGCPVVYSGSIDRVDFSEEKQAKGFCLVTLEDNVCENMEFVRINAREMITIRVDLNGYTDPTIELIKAINERHCHDAIVRVLYTLDEDNVDIKKVHSALNDAYHIHGIQHISKKQDERPVVLKGDSPIETIGEYIEQHDEYKTYKNNLLLLAKEYIGDE